MPFGSYANFPPRIHAIVTDGLVGCKGVFHSLDSIDTEAIENRCRRLVLDRLVRAERLSEAVRQRLLSWERSDFSVHAGEAIEAKQRESLERMARYVTRAPVALSKVFREKDGRVRLPTPLGTRRLVWSIVSLIPSIGSTRLDPRDHDTDSRPAGASSFGSKTPRDPR